MLDKLLNLVAFFLGTTLNLYLIHKTVNKVYKLCGENYGKHLRIVNVNLTCINLEHFYLEAFTISSYRI